MEDFIDELIDQGQLDFEEEQDALDDAVEM